MTLLYIRNPSRHLSVPCFIYVFCTHSIVPTFVIFALWSHTHPKVGSSKPVRGRDVGACGGGVSKVSVNVRQQVTHNSRHSRTHVLWWQTGEMTAKQGERKRETELTFTQSTTDSPNLTTNQPTHHPSNNQLIIYPLSTYPSIHPSIWMTNQTFIYPSIHPTNQPFIHHPLIHPSIWLTDQPSIHLSMQPTNKPTTNP